MKICKINAVYYSIKSKVQLYTVHTINDRLCLSLIFSNNHAGYGGGLWLIDRVRDSRPEDRGSSFLGH